MHKVCYDYYLALESGRRNPKLNIFKESRIQELFPPGISIVLQSGIQEGESHIENPESRMQNLESVRWNPECK